VLCEYTGNARYPWRFASVKETNQLVAASTQDPNSYNVFIYDVAHNFMVLQGNSAALVAAEVSAYLRANRNDYTYDYTDHAVDAFQPRADNIKLYCFYDRYICISTGAYLRPDGSIVYKIILVYDKALRRYGRIVVEHNYVVAAQDPNSTERTIAAIDAGTGTAVNFLFNLHEGSGTATDGVLILGKFQYVRSRRLELHDIMCEGQFQHVNCYVLPAGESTVFNAAVSAVPVVSSDTHRQYNCRAEGSTLAVAFEGAFNMDFAQFTFSLGGGR